MALYLQRSLHETSSTTKRQYKDAGTLSGLWRNRRAFMIMLGFIAAGSLSFYTYTTYMQKYLVNTAAGWMQKPQAV